MHRGTLGGVTSSNVCEKKITHHFEDHDVLPKLVVVIPGAGEAGKPSGKHLELDRCELETSQPTSLSLSSFSLQMGYYGLPISRVTQA